MSLESELEIHFPSDFKRALGPYMEATGAMGIGQFLLKAINFDLRCTGKPKISTAACLVENIPYIGEDWQHNRALIHIVKMTFSGQASEAILSLIAEKGSETELRWLMRMVQTYVNFLDSRHMSQSQPRPVALKL